MYSRFHKVHHEWKAPIALAASYAHPVELMTCNVLPLMMGPVLCRAHIVTTYVWFIVAIFGSMMHHCGYRFWWAHIPSDPQPDFHDYHHENFTGNYGLLSILDKFHGTDKDWRELKLKSN